MSTILNNMWDFLFDWFAKTTTANQSRLTLLRFECHLKVF